MKVETFDNQTECNLLLDAAGVRHVAQPQPGQVVCDFIMQLDADIWFVGTNDRGKYTIHILTEAAKAEAWAFFEKLRGPGNKYVHPRVSFIGGEPANPSAN